MKTGLKKPLPQRRRVQRVSGEQDLTVGAAPRFGKRTVIQGIINIESISSHSYIKEASEGHGFAMWRMPNRGFALAVDKIYLREGGNLQTIQDVNPPYAGNFINLKQNQIIVVRTSTTGEGHAIDVYPRGSNSNGIGCVTEAGSTGWAIYGLSQGTGHSIYGANTGGGSAGYFDGQVDIIGLAACVTDVRVGITAGSLYIGKIAEARADIATFGQFWVRDGTPYVPMFTDDTGADFTLDKTAA